jgi:methionyl-tRNA synthetase
MVMQEIISQLPAPLNLIPAWALVLLMTWMVVWKGLALWKSAKLNQPVWFIFLLVVNTMGILEILYIYVFSKFGYDHLRFKKPKK